MPADLYAWKLALLPGLLCRTALSAPAQTLVRAAHSNEAALHPHTWTSDPGDGCERGVCDGPTGCSSR